MKKIEWFEIPAANFQRAIDFYQQVFDKTLDVRPYAASEMAVFSNDSGEGVGCIIYGSDYVPSEHGVVIYLDASPSIDATIARIAPAGGKVTMDKIALPEGMGFIAYFHDTEGNRLGLHAMA
jgi:predicted enzyme related to lactoylglutathione lyase